VFDLVCVQVRHGYNHRMAANEQLAMLVQARPRAPRGLRRPAIFELEMERVSAARGSCSGTRARSKHPGDYFTTRMGGSPSLSLTDNKIGVLINRCAHRGTMVCAEGRGKPSGSSVHTTAWSYDRAGCLRAVPFAVRYRKRLMPNCG
jgi:phenylpropionate dioxygenase-like ring-hydroxylating dioxygenase large terminal subunit